MIIFYLKMTKLLSFSNKIQITLTLYSHYLTFMIKVLKKMYLVIWISLKWKSVFKRTNYVIFCLFFLNFYYKITKQKYIIVIRSFFFACYQDQREAQKVIIGESSSLYNGKVIINVDCREFQRRQPRNTLFFCFLFF